MADQRDRTWTERERAMRTRFMSRRIVSAQRITVLVLHHVICCVCQCARSCGGWRSILTIALQRRV
eukprot:552911-Rhodomonas_salina.2